MIHSAKTAMAKNGTITLDVLMYQQDGVWVGHCVQLDILTSGPDQDQVHRDINDLVVAQIEFAMQDEARMEHLFRPPSEDLMERMAFAVRENQPVEIQLNTNLGAGKRQIRNVKIMTANLACA